MTRAALKPLLAVALLIAATPIASVAQGEKHGYLAPDALDLLQVLPTAPVKGEVRYESDRKIFKTTRRLVGTPRWVLATNDVKLSSADMLRDFSCAVGVALTPQNAPRTTALIEKAGIDTTNQTRAAKNFYRRQRPYLIDRGTVCQAPSELVGSFDYPSGHTTRGWTWASVLADLAPDRATQILARGRAFGESRIVCGVHNETAVEAGFMSASATLAAVEATSAYQSDRDGARAELAALRADPSAPRPEACEAEARLISQSIYALPPARR